MRAVTPTMEDDELHLPKATVANFIKKQIPKNIRCSAECRDLFVQCATEFIQLISSEATDICTKQNKSKINGEYICAALESLDMKDYIPEMKKVADDLIDGVGENELNCLTIVEEKEE